MTPERWQQVKDLFHQAREAAPDARAALLAAACAGDPELRREVESLLSAHAAPGDFLRRPVIALGQSAAAPTNGSAAGVTAGLTSGQTIGPYQIERQLGAGGMGVVYLARDTRLGRLVALKLLQPRFTQDEERVRRFQREARAASALNHPNLLTIHEVGQAARPDGGGVHFIATEFVAGQTLRALFHQGGLTLGAALDLFIQVTGALAAAHEAGIIHRDLKPENIMLRPDGIAKVLDFGLAKLTERRVGEWGSGGEGEKELLSSSFPPSPSLSLSTQPGLVMGTLSYMSPEQARGLTVDARSDIFSLGVVLYETLTGHAPFAGETAGDVLVALLNGQPRPLAHYAPLLPSALQAILDQALATSPAERYQTARALNADLRRLKEEWEFAARLQGHAVNEDPLLAMTVGTATADGAQATFATRTLGAPTTAQVTTRRGRLRRHGQRMLLALAALLLLGAGAWWGWRWLASRAQVIDSIAVLPFANAGNDPQAEYLPDGLTESLIGSLSQLPALTVMARSTVFTYKGHALDPRQVGAALKVSAVVMGRVEQQGDLLLIYVELVDTANGARLWGERYQRALADLPVVQEEITREVSAALQRRLGGAAQQQFAKRQTVNSEAYQAYLRGRYLYNVETRAELEKALVYFNQAIKLDPNYALAYTGVADVYATLSAAYLPPREAITQARAAALTALKLDETLPEAHLMLARVKLWGDWDWAGAERAVQRALALNPNLAEAHAFYAGLLSQQGRFAEALRVAQRSEQLDPLSITPNLEVGGVFYYSRQYDRALAHYRKLIELHPANSWAHRYLGFTLAEQGRHQEAISEMRQALALNPHNTNRSALGYVYGRAGERDKALQMLRDLQARANREIVSPVYIARIYVGLGEKDQALTWLRKAYAEHFEQLIHVGTEPVYDPLRGDPRFTALLRDLGFTL